MKPLITLLLLIAIGILHAGNSQAQTGLELQSFEKIELFEPAGRSIKQTDVKIRFDNNTIFIEEKRSGNIIKQWLFREIRSAEYSYSKSPRWKTGLGLGAASILFPPLLLVAIPLGFTKHRRHWLTITTDKDFAVLKLSKNNRKFVIPTLETRTGIRVAGVGETK